MRFAPHSICFAWFHVLCMCLNEFVKVFYVGSRNSRNRSCYPNGTTKNWAMAEQRDKEKKQSRFRHFLLLHVVTCLLRCYILCVSFLACSCVRACLHSFVLLLLFVLSISTIKVVLFFIFFRLRNRFNGMKQIERNRVFRFSALKIACRYIL